MIEYLPNMAMLCLLIGTLPSMIQAVKNRKNLIGFSFIGAVGLLIGQVLFVIYFASLNDVLTTLFELPLVAYWALVVIYTKKSVEAKKSNHR